MDDSKIDFTDVDVHRKITGQNALIDVKNLG